MRNPFLFEERQVRGDDPWWFWNDGDFDWLGVECEIPRRPDWFVTAEFVLGRQGPILQSVRVDPVERPDGPPGLTLQVARSFTTNWLYRLANEAIEMGRWVDEVAAAQPLESFRQRPRPGRGGRVDTDYAVVVARYLQHVRTNPRTARKALAEDLSLSPSQVSNLLNQARQRGILTSAGKGRAGGQLTDKGKQLLATNSDA